MEPSSDDFKQLVEVVVTVSGTLISKILSGEKRVEFRKVWPRASVHTVWFCEKASGGRVVLHAGVETAISHRASDAWRLYGRFAGVSETEFFAYVAPARAVHCVILKNIEEVRDTLVCDLGVLTPPQNYTFVNR